jgi:hypothetical protein
LKIVGVLLRDPIGEGRSPQKLREMRTLILRIFLMLARLIKRGVVKEREVPRTGGGENHMI